MTMFLAELLSNILMSPLFHQQCRTWTLSLEPVLEYRLHRGSPLLLVAAMVMMMS